MITRSAELVAQNPTIDDESGQIVNEEINRLPDRFRSAVVLCYLEGLTHEMAADQLGCPVGTVRSRLATGRDRLRHRLTRRGLAPAASSLEVSGATLAVPASLLDSTVRGALHVGLGKAALGTIVSAEAVALVDGISKTAIFTKLTLLALAISFAAILEVGFGHLKHFRLPRADGRAAPTVDDSTGRQPEDPPLNKVQALMKESQTEFEAYLIAESKARSVEEKSDVRLRHQKALKTFADALLNEAELARESPLAEEALVWIVTHVQQDPILERAKMVLIRDHIRSASIGPVFDLSKLFLSRSRITEQLMRVALTKSPHREIQALACFTLARYLEIQAFDVRKDQSIDPAQRKRERATETKEVQAYLDDLDKLGSDALDDEAATLHERVVNEFGDLPSHEPLPNLAEDELAGARPATFGEISRIYLNDHLFLGIGKPAPEIEGVDLDNRPMKLSDYRGKVVILYFGGPVPSGDAGNRAATITEAVQEVARRHADDPLVLLGVSTISPGPSAGREAYQMALNARRMPARFWWDLTQHNRPGPIQTTWNARGQVQLYVLDHRGVIRHKHYFGAADLERSVTELLKEHADKTRRSR